MGPPDREADEWGDGRGWNQMLSSQPRQPQWEERCIHKAQGGPTWGLRGKPLPAIMQVHTPEATEYPHPLPQGRAWNRQRTQKEVPLLPRGEPGRGPACDRAGLCWAGGSRPPGPVCSHQDARTAALVGVGRGSRDISRPRGKTASQWQTSPSQCGQAHAGQRLTPSGSHTPKPSGSVPSQPGPGWCLPTPTAQEEPSSPGNSPGCSPQ